MRLKTQLDIDQPVLVVEDETFIACEVEVLLEGLGFKSVDVCMTLDEGRRRLESKRFGLAVIDLNMRGQLSFPLIDEAVARGLAVVTMSGYLSNEVELAQTAFLPKPIRPGALSAAIVLARKKADLRREALSADRCDSDLVSPVV